MGRILLKTRAVVLRSMRLGETSKLLTLYAEECGKLKVVARGARKPRSKFGGALEVMCEVQALCYVRQERELHTLSDCDLVRAFSSPPGHLERLAFGCAACELVDRLTIAGEPNRRLYRCLVGVLKGLEEVEPARVEPLFWYFQLRVAAALGYRPQLSRCAACGQTPSGARPGFSPALGGALCPGCSADGSLRIGADSLRFLAALQGLKTYARRAIPPAPAQREEIRSLLYIFLEYHGGQRGRLNSLDFLDSISSRAESIH